MNPHPGLDPICHTASLPPNPGPIMAHRQAVPPVMEEASLVLPLQGLAIQAPAHPRHHVLLRQAVLLHAEDNSTICVKKSRNHKTWNELWVPALMFSLLTSTMQILTRQGIVKNRCMLFLKRQLLTASERQLN